MEKLKITGMKKLMGEVTVSGAKNAAVAIIPAAVIADGISVIENLPFIEDVSSLHKTINKIGAKCDYKDKHTLIIDSSNIKSPSAIYDEVRKIRASYYLIGAFLARFKEAKVALPGGCNFGNRPIDQHLKGFKALGAEINVDYEQGIVHAKAKKLVGTSIYLDVVSVGATINIMLAATLAEGMTTIENAAKEPHVVDTANFLNMMGAKIKGAGTDVIRIYGVEKLHGANYAIIPDQIEAGTYMIAGAITHGNVLVKNVIPTHLDSLSAKLLEMDITVKEYDDSIRIIADKPFKNVNVKTMAYPGFPTDLQPQMTALLSVAKGKNIITENVWEHRFQYIAEMKKLGADIIVADRVATINGVDKLKGAEVHATDLRAGAAMILAGLAAEGETIIDGLKYIDRGYEEVEKKFGSLGAQIERIDI